MGAGYETALPDSSRFCLALPFDSTASRPRIVVSAICHLHCETRTRNGVAGMVGSDDVWVRWLSTELAGEAETDGLADLLDAGERSRAARFRHDAARRAFVIGHALVRVGLAKLTGRSARSWEFRTGRHGRPEPILRRDEPLIRFSLSHSHDVVAVALSVEHDIGVDIERVDNRMHLPNDALAPGEKRYLAGLPKQRADAAFFHIWTLKEAYLKALGTGLSRPLASFEVSLSPMAITERNGFRAEGWFMGRFEPGRTHTGAIVMRHPDPDRVRFQVETVGLETLAKHR